MLINKQKLIKAAAMVVAIGVSGSLFLSGHYTEAIGVIASAFSSTSAVVPDTSQ